MKGIVLVLTLFFSCVQPAYAMEAPGDGDLGWYYDQEFHHWYYCHEDQTIQTGWMKYHGEWYWFDRDGWMADRGNVTIDGVPYYFFLNGHMAWNQYVGMMFYGEDGRRWEKKDVRPGFIFRLYVSGSQKLAGPIYSGRLGVYVL